MDQYARGVSSSGALDRARADLVADARRVTDRLRGLSHARLASGLPPYASRADAAHHVAGLLAVAAQGLADHDRPEPPSWRVLPRLSDFAAGDQVAVTAADLLAEVDALPDPAPEAWTPAGRRPAAEVVVTAAAELAALRRRL